MSSSTAGESIAYRVIIPSVLGPVVALPLCGIRMYTKLYILRNTGHDDYAIALATILALGFSITTCYQTTNGLGKHIGDVSPYQFHQLMKIGDIAGPIFYNLSTLCIKTSLCLFYLRFSVSRGFHTVIYALLAVCVIYSSLAAFGFAWVCQPKERYWDFSITSGSCVDLDALFLANACINAATDFVLLVLPLFIIKDLTLPRRRKIGVALLLMTGSFVLVVSLIRVEAVVRGMGKIAKDGTWAMVTNFIWILVEMWMGVICTCLPTLHTFVKNRWAARCAKLVAKNNGNAMPEHQWIGLQDTPERPSSASKPVAVVNFLDSKSHGSDSSMARTIVCEEASLPPASHSNTRSTEVLAV
ncbi:hypothetical protein COCMIDRAFT_93891 [Bipolaris oryzae ATCC 44560]|uniref:Rhodopsin domain-containing protein n=1 Tax=Bipolaris oryzae ATCC 44560 TaxID=930090 RepID=W6Z8F9_COCMI|nr:uncharacterized protein COCMIDRAFT_93891 [Bipolaris oryzae ATCC 44560]EUC46078.1 hypothetical protein COCMIDRAFT_93891 [Bipolaris oryzae ATCC 44560]